MFVAGNETRNQRESKQILRRTAQDSRAIMRLFIEVTIGWHPGWQLAVISRRMNVTSRPCTLGYVRATSKLLSSAHPPPRKKLYCMPRIYSAERI